MDILINNAGKESKYTLPETWNEVPLDTYMKTQEALHETKEEEQTEQIVNLVNCLTGIPKDTVRKLQLKQIKELHNEIANLVKTKPEEELKFIVNIKGIDYGFIPDLSEISIGEFADIEHHIKDNPNYNLHKLLSVLYRPVTDSEGDKYSIEPYEPSDERAELFKENMKVEDFNGASVFFSDLGRQLLIHTAQSLVAQKQKKKQLQEVS